MTIDFEICATINLQIRTLFSVQQIKPRSNWMIQKAPYAVRLSSFRFPCVPLTILCVYNIQYVVLMPTLHLTLPSSLRSGVSAPLLKHFIFYSSYLLPQVTVLFPLLSVLCSVSSMALLHECMSEGVTKYSVKYKTYFKSHTSHFTRIGTQHCSLFSPDYI
jgi:hypothetical protein